MIRICFILCIINFVFIADFKKKSIMDGDDAHKMRSIYLDSGHVTMALSLFASANNMKGVVRAMVDTEPLLDFLKLILLDKLLNLELFFKLVLLV